MWSCRELFARDLKATVEKAQGHQTNKKVWESAHPEFDHTSHPLHWRVPCLSLSCLELRVPAQHSAFHGTPRTLRNEAHFQHAHCIPQCSTQGPSTGTLPRSQSPTTNHLWWGRRTRGKIWLPNGLFSLLGWIRETGKIEGMHPGEGCCRLKKKINKMQTLLS